MIIICSELNHPNYMTNNWGYLFRIQIVSLFSKFYFLSTLINIIYILNFLMIRWIKSIFFEEVFYYNPNTPDTNG